MARYFLVGATPTPPITGALPVSEPVILFVCGLIAAAFGYFLTREVKVVEKRLDRIENALDLTKSEISELPKNYVTRDDFLRALAAMDDRLDALEGKIENKLDQVLDHLRSK